MTLNILLIPIQQSVNSHFWQGIFPADFVLKDFSSTEKKELPTTLEIAADAVEAIVTKGLTEAQQVYHSQ